MVEIGNYKGQTRTYILKVLGIKSSLQPKMQVSAIKATNNKILGVVFVVITGMKETKQLFYVAEVSEVNFCQFSQGGRF